MVSKREITVAGQSVWLCGMTGVVAGEKKWSESRVSGGGGGGYMHHGGGYIAPQSIKTTVSTRHEFWLVASDGEERCVEMGNSNIAVREGQLMTAIWGAEARSKDGPYLMLRNNNAQTDNWLISDAKSLLKRMGLSDPATKFGLIGIGIALLLFCFTRHEMAVVLPLIVILASFGYGTHQRTVKGRAIKEAVTGAMHLEVQEFGQQQNSFRGQQQGQLT